MNSFSMCKLTRVAIWLFVFSVPWGIMNSVFGLASITRFLGLAAIGLGGATVVLEGRMRKPGSIFWAAVIFVMSTELSLLWTISYAATAQQVTTYIQLVAVIWLVGEFVRTRDEHESILRAFWLGSFVVAIDLLWNFVSGPTLSERYTATDFNPNYIGFTLAMGFPMAWRQFSSSRGATRVAAAAFCSIAPLALLLTASRSAALAGAIGLAIVPLTLRRPSRSLLPITAVGCAAAITIGLLVPQSTWERVLTTRTEIQQGTLGGRGDIWAAGWVAFQERPVLGSGTATYRDAIRPFVRHDLPGHNLALSLLVEQGIVGLSLFVVLLGACVWAIVHLPSVDRKMWIVLMLGWSVMAMAHDSHNDKVTWVLFGLLAAQRALPPVRRRVAEERPMHAGPFVTETLVAHSRGFSTN